MLKKYLWSTYCALGTAQSMGSRTQIKAGSRSPGVYVLVGKLQDIPMHKCVTANGGKCYGWGGGQCGIEWSRNGI